MNECFLAGRSFKAGVEDSLGVEVDVCFFEFQEFTGHHGGIDHYEDISAEGNAGGIGGIDGRYFFGGEGILGGLFFRREDDE